MKTKNTLILLIVAAAVFGAIFYINQKEEETLSTAAIPVKSLPAITSGTIERIVVDPPDAETVTLTRSNDKWYTNIEKQYEADDNAITGIFSAMNQPIEAKVVSTNPDSFAEYHVSETSGTHVQIFENGKEAPVLDVLVGKDSASAFSTYIRMKDGKEVLNAQANLSMTFKRPDGWRNKQIFQFSGNNATRIEAEGTSSTFTVTKSGEGTWQFAAPSTGTVEQARIMSLANMLSNLRANEFIEPKDNQTLADFGLEPARQSLALTYEDKSTSPSAETSVTLLIGRESNTPGEWYAKRSGKNDIFTVGQHIADALSPDPDSLKAPEPEPEPEQTPEPVAAVGETTAPETVVEDNQSTPAVTTVPEPSIGTETEVGPATDTKTTVAPIPAAQETIPTPTAEPSPALDSVETTTSSV